MDILERLAQIQADIATHAPGRAVTLVAVTKYTTLDRMREAYAAGVRHFGENKVQDARVKMDAFPPADYPGLHWHFIGSLQGNKARKTVGRFSLLHAVDSLRLAETLSRVNMAEDQRQSVLLQVNVSGDASRHGFLPEALPEALTTLHTLEGIDVRGLMAMAPPEISLTGDTIALQEIFSKVARLRDKLSAESGKPLPELSMGMSHDFISALSSGATLIRIGNFLFQNG